jgi:hypothetical protein
MELGPNWLMSSLFCYPHETDLGKTAAKLSEQRISPIAPLAGNFPKTSTKVRDLPQQAPQASFALIVETRNINHGLSTRNRFRSRGRGVPSKPALNFRSPPFPRLCRLTLSFLLQGRAGLVAWRRSRGGVGALGNAFYKGGFEQKMNKREATLILALK